MWKLKVLGLEANTKTSQNPALVWTARTMPPDSSPLGQQNMKIEDENELYRLTDMLKSVSDQLDPTSPIHEGLKKAALALHLSFRQGYRLEIEKMYSDIGKPLSAEQIKHLNYYGIEHKKT
jgi:hypothetical protein